MSKSNFDYAAQAHHAKHIRIAYIINQYPMVSHTFIRREILALEKQGFEILRIALRGWDAKLADADDQREKLHTQYVLRNGIFSLAWHMLQAAIFSPARFLHAFSLAFRMRHGSRRSLPYHMIYLAEACRILPWLESFKATHIHAHFASNSTEVAMLASALAEISYSFTVHGQAELHSGGLAEKVKRASFIVAISSFGRSQLYQLINQRQWHKINVIHCGLEAAFHTLEPAPVPEIARIVCVGRLSKEKGQLLLIEAAHQLALKKIKFELVLAGDGGMRSEIEELIAQLDLTSQIRITGWIGSTQVREEIIAARALVLPSFSEGLPVVIMEAMALRRPVIATYVGGIPELIQPGENGWLVPAGSVNDMVIAIEECLSSSQVDLQTMGDANYLRALTRHSIESESQKLGTLFQESCS